MSSDPQLLPPAPGTADTAPAKVEPSRSDAFLPFTRPSLCEAAIEEVEACLRSGWLATGPRVARFEAALADYLEAREVVAVSSGTAGLHLALAALNLAPGDEVITTPLTFVATSHAIVRAGARPVFVEVDPGTRNLAVDAVERALTPRTRVLLPVHFAGLPADLDALYALARRHGLRVIEDAAHAIGAGLGGRRVGGMGDTQVFSFHANKNITTGEGGAIATADPELARRVRRLRFHGIDRSEGAPWPYDVPEAGFKFNMMDLQAALGLHQLPRLDRFIEARTRLAARYTARLADQRAWALPAPPPYEHRHAWHLFTVCLDLEHGLTRREFVAEMERRGIGVGVHYPPVHLLRFYREHYGYALGDLPRAEAVGASIVSLPLFPGMTGRDVDRVVDAMNEVLP